MSAAAGIARDWERVDAAREHYENAAALRAEHVLAETLKAFDWHPGYTISARVEPYEPRSVLVRVTTTHPQRWASSCQALYGIFGLAIRTTEIRRLADEHRRKLAAWRAAPLEAIV